MIEEVVKRFKKGEVVIFPTDTVYGVGCVISNEEAIKKLHRLRGDPTNKPTLILAAHEKQAFNYGIFNEIARKLAQNFWPGPLTMVVKAKENVPKIIQGEVATVAIRVPKQPPILDIIERVGKPILAPSANFHYQPPPTSFAEIDKKLISLVDYAIDIANLKNALAMIRIPSTVVRVNGQSIKIIRTGAITLKNLEKVLEGPKE